MNEALRIMLNDKYSSFDGLLGKSASVRIHHRNLQLLAGEIYMAWHNTITNPDVRDTSTEKYKIRSPGW